jgi:hypothetical protein
VPRQDPLEALPKYLARILGSTGPAGLDGSGADDLAVGQYQNGGEAEPSGDGGRLHSPGAERGVEGPVGIDPCQTEQVGPEEVRAPEGGLAL